MADLEGANLASRSGSPNKVIPEVHEKEHPQRYMRTATHEGQKKPERKGSRGRREENVKTPRRLGQTGQSTKKCDKDSVMDRQW